jgi:hypothetical protein
MSGSAEPTMTGTPTSGATAQSRKTYTSRNLNSILAKDQQPRE